MTTRQYLLRRANATIGGSLVFLVVAGAWLSANHRGFVLRFVLAVLGAAVALAAFWSLFEIPCLNCRKSLGSTGFRVASGLMRESAPKCPHCGLSLDAAMPGKR
jgi:hypothetical protein